MPLNFHPPLLNSANPWATTREDIEELYDCPSTGAFTTRTSLIQSGFLHDPAIHQHCFFDTTRQSPTPPPKNDFQAHPPSTASKSSLNTYGYSPYPLSEYLNIIQEILADRMKQKPSATPKPVIVSIAGSLDEIRKGLEMIATRIEGLRQECHEGVRILVELNLSCPNIVGHPPPAYSMPELEKVLEVCEDYRHRIEIGVKLPPYTYQTQFDSLIALFLAFSRNSTFPISFITSTNTLGSSLVLSNSPDMDPALKSQSGEGMGGLAGAALHPLALGNVRTLRQMLDQCKSLKWVEIIGVGGVSGGDGYRRMKRVGASAVGVGTALGVEGVGVFGRIAAEVEREGW